MSDTQGAAGRRINSLLDANSFVEIGAQVTARSTDFNLSSAKAPSDGVVTGYGTVDGSLVYVYSQDASVMGGSVGEMHARKIVNILRMARHMGAPVVGILDCSGVRLEESTDSLNGLGEIYRAMSMNSGVVPQIAAVIGSCGGGLAFIPALSDFAFMAEGASLFVNAPDAIEGNTVEQLDNRKADFQAESGNVDVTGTEEEVFAAIRDLLGYLPANNEDEGEQIACTDDLNRSCGAISGVETAREAIAQIADNGIFFETKKDHATGIITGFIRLNGTTVGVVANKAQGAVICGCGAEKAADFISFCDGFSIPVLTLASPSGFARKERVERVLPAAAARLIHAYASATVPKVTVVTGKAYGSAYAIMGSKAMGADMVFAWPNAEIGAMDARAAAKIISADSASVKENADAFAALQLSVASAAQRGYVDTIIEDADTRKYVIGAFEMLYTKREYRPDKKHGTV